MKMKKIAGIVMVCSVLCLLGNRVVAQESRDYSRSVALILTVTGEDKVIRNVEIFQTDVFEGKAKNLYTTGSVHSSSTLHVQVLNSSNEILWDAYLDNPLDLQLESFNPDGSIERSKLVKEEGHVNLRFPLPEGSGMLTLKCYQYFSAESESLVSTLQLNYK